MLPGIFRLVNISRSAAFLFRYCDSSCVSSSYFKKTQNFYQTISFQESGKSKENRPALSPQLFWFPHGVYICFPESLWKEDVGGTGPRFQNRVGQITRWDKRGKREERGRANYLAEFFLKFTSDSMVFCCLFGLLSLF